jgi:hypothetical protein
MELATGRSKKVSWSETTLRLLLASPFGLDWPRKAQSSRAATAAAAAGRVQELARAPFSWKHCNWGWPIQAARDKRDRSRKVARCCRPLLDKLLFASRTDQLHISYTGYADPLRVNYWNFTPITSASGNLADLRELARVHRLLLFLFPTSFLWLLLLREALAPAAQILLWMEAAGFISAAPVEQWERFRHWNLFFGCKSEFGADAPPVEDISSEWALALQCQC